MMLRQPTIGIWVLLGALSGCTIVDPSVATSVRPEHSFAIEAGSKKRAETESQPLPFGQAGEAVTGPRARQGAKVSAEGTAEPARSEPAFATERPALGERATDRVKLTGRRTGPRLCVLNSKRISLDYELKDIDPSVVTGIELWYQTASQVWRRMNGPLGRLPPYVVDVSDDGLYGFTLLTRTKDGLMEPPPQAGDSPQIWIDVDQTKPMVRLGEVKPAGPRGVALNWEASDRNLAQRPITISVAEQPEGPWTVIVSNLENNGHYVWQAPADHPNRFYLRVEALDVVGNTGADQKIAAILPAERRHTANITSVGCTPTQQRGVGVVRVFDYDPSSPERGQRSGRPPSGLEELPERRPVSSEATDGQFHPRVSAGHSKPWPAQGSD